MYVALNGAVPLHQPASELDFSLSELATRIKRELTYYTTCCNIKKFIASQKKILQQCIILVLEKFKQCTILVLEKYKKLRCA